MKNNVNGKSIRDFCVSLDSPRVNSIDTMYNRFCGIGIITENRKENCILWKYSQWNYYKLIENTTICQYHMSKYYCATKYSWDYCQVIQCLSTTTSMTCEADIKWTSTDSSIEISFTNMTNKNTLLILLYDQYNNCQIGKLCQNCENTNSMIDKHFHNCTQLKGDDEFSQRINFIHLLSNNLYEFYIIPVVDYNSMGTMAKLLLSTNFSIIPKLKSLQVSESETHFNIIMELDLSNSIENYYFIILGKNSQNQCLYFILLSCDKCKVKLEKYLNESNKRKVNEMKNCPTKAKENFDKSISKFMINLQKNKIINDEKITANISIYSINVKGLHNIGWKYLVKNENISYNFLLIIIICGFLLFSILCGFLVYYKFYSRKLIKSSDNESINSVESNVEQLKMREMENTDDPSQYYQEDQIETWTKEFKDICKEADKFEKRNNYKVIVAKLPENESKNRFKYLLPFDKTRVILKDNQDGNDYINASFIPFENDVTKSEYIACQGPVLNGVSDFWLMIWQQDISIIVMLTRTYENTKFKCYQYWPDEIGKSEEYCNDFLLKVTLENEINTGTFIERKFNILNQKSLSSRMITQLQMCSWLDKRALKFEDFEIFIYRFHELIMQNNWEPYLIHCSGGVGRTGTFIVIDRIIRKFTKGKSDINIIKEVLELRKHRKGAIQRKIQYFFIYEFIEYFRQKYIRKTFNSYEEIN